MEGYVATIGMFDGVHKGHQFVLRQVVACAQQHGLYPLCITFDHSPRCEQMLTPLNEKLRLIRLTGIEHIEVLHFTEALKQLTAREFMEQMLLKQLHVKMLLTGYDNRFGHNRNEGFDDYVRYGHELGIEVRALPAEGTVSSSHVRKLLQEGLVSEAAECLGHPYRISGIVTHGEHIGTGLGFPTAARESNAVHITKMFLQVFIVFISICSVVNVPTIINAVKQEILHHWALNVLNHRA